MRNRIDILKETWELESISSLKFITEDEISLFQTENNLLIPSDLVEYFKVLNGSNEEYTDRFFKFYSLSNFKSINDDLKNWNGVPNYSNIINTLDDYKSYYVFADYSFCMFSYAIKLYADVSISNQVLVLSGDEYKIIANSFSEFLDLYMINSIELQLNKEGH